MNKVVTASAEAGASKPIPDSELHKQINVALDLAFDPGAERIALSPSVDASQSGQDHNASLENPPPVSLRELYKKTSVPRTLKMAAAQLTLLRRIADDCIIVPFLRV